MGNVALTVNLFGDIEVWDSVDAYLDGLPYDRMIAADRVGDADEEILALLYEESDKIVC